MSLTINRQLTQGADTLNTIMGRHQTAMSKSLEKISTGLRINSAGDDSAGNAISEKMQTQIRALDQSHENTQSANSLLKVADAAISTMVDVIRAMHTKALEGANDYLNEEDRQALAIELNQLKDQVATSAMVTHNGRYLLTGDYGTIDETLNNYAVYDTDGKPFTDDDGNIIYEDHLDFSNFGWKGENSLYFQIGPNRNEGVVAHLMDMTEDHIFKGVTIDVSSVAAANKTAKSLEKSLTRVLYQQTEIGTLQERLEFTSDNLQMQSDETTDALSAIRDADMAKEMTNYVKNNVLMQATQAMMAQANTSLASFIDLVKQ